MRKNSRMRIAAIRKLAAELQVLDPKTHEAFFEAYAKQKGLSFFRAGWPDYLAFRPDGRPVFVEVKGPGDSIRPAQARMFAALERVRIQVLIWEPQAPDRLRPWRSFAASKQAKIDKQKARLEQRRVLNLTVLRVAK